MSVYCCVLFHVIVQIRVGGLPPISKHREKSELRGEADRAFLTNFKVRSEIRGSPTYEYLNVLLKLSRRPISRENLGKVWLNSCNFFPRFPNIVHATDFLFWGGGGRG